MTWIVLLFGALIFVGGIVGTTKPQWFRDALLDWQGRTRWLTAFLTRLVLGFVLIYAADSLRHPLVAEILGIIALVAGVVILLAGQSRLDRLITWYLGFSLGFIRFQMVFVILFGAYLAYIAT